MTRDSPHSRDQRRQTAQRTRGPSSPWMSNSALVTVALAAVGAVLLLMRSSWWSGAGYADQVPSAEGAGTTSIPRCADTIIDWIEDVRMGPRETTAVTLSDVDSDGNVDALFTNQVDETVSIWWGESGRMPTVRTDIQVGRSQWPVAVGDLNGDGWKDIVAALQDDSAFALLRAESARVFRAPVRIFQSPPPNSVALADGDDDGHLDVLFSESSGRVNLRRVIGQQWLPHEPLMNTVPNMRVEGLAKFGESALLLGGTASIAEMRGLTGEIVLPAMQVERWLPTEYNSLNGAFGWTEAGRIVRLRFGESPCDFAPAGNTWSIRAIGDLNGDGTTDAVALDSCRECTSNHVFLRGVPGPGEGQ